jgi:phosphopantothenoylcysteine synthetase/decarboxylase
LNDIARDDIGFDSEENEVTLIAAGAERTVPRAGKDEIAAAILDFAHELRLHTGADRPLVPEADA